jgi:hypothetical protein
LDFEQIVNNNTLMRHAKINICMSLVNITPKPKQEISSCFLAAAIRPNPRFVILACGGRSGIGEGGESGKGDYAYGTNQFMPDSPFAAWQQQDVQMQRKTLIIKGCSYF